MKIEVRTGIQADFQPVFSKMRMLKYSKFGSLTKYVKPETQSLCLKTEFYFLTFSHVSCLFFFKIAPTKKSPNKDIQQLQSSFDEYRAYLSFVL